VPQISAIEPQRKRKNRFNIYLDGHFAFGIDENTLVKNHLKVNQHLSEDQIEKIIKENVLIKLQDSALKFLSYRPRSEKEVSDYLVGKIAKQENIKYSQAKESPQIEPIISKFKKYKYLDDRQFAKWWITSRKIRPKGLQIVKWELKKKGITDDIIKKVAEYIPDQKKLAQRAIAKKIKLWQKLPPLNRKKKIYQFLASRGFDFDTIKEVFAHFAKKQ